MNTYKAGYSTNPELREAEARIERALNAAQPEFTLFVRYSAPDKTWAGMLIYADGTTWNPGAGEGVYVRDKANAAWRHLG